MKTRAPLAGALTSIVLATFAGAVEAGPIEPFTVTANAPREREVGPSAKRLMATVKVTCSLECAARATGVLMVERRGKPTLRLRLKADRAELRADRTTELSPRLARSNLKRLNSALDSRGAVASARFRIRAAESSGESARAEAATSYVPGFGIVEANVSPGLAFFDGKREPALGFRFRAPARTDLRVELRRDGGPAVRAWRIGSARPFSKRRVKWSGLTENGGDGRDGRYSFYLGPAGERLKRVGGFKFRGHVFPVEGPHGVRGAVGEFGAGRNGGRTHEGFDITADCGTRLVAARGGEVVRRGFDPVLYGWFLEIRARKSGRRLFYSHLRTAPAVRDGERVRTAQKVGEVGRTGNAASTPCHLHFEIRVDGRSVDPEPELRRWDGWS